VRKARRRPGFGPTRLEKLRLDKEFIELVQSANGIDRFSEKLFTTYQATQYLVRNEIPGDFVECGVYKGRHICMMAITLLQLGVTEREIYLYDTFAGMTEPGPEDRRAGGRLDAEGLRAKWQSLRRGQRNLWAYAPLEQVRRNVYATGYPTERFHFVNGNIKETIPNGFHSSIALLRLDTDWYELTRHELGHLYGLLAPKGVLIVDDYGSLEGARKAVEEFFAARNDFPFLFRTTKNERAMIKVL